MAKWVWDAELRKALKLKASTPPEICAKWLQLAPWAAKLSRSHREREVFTIRGAEPIAVAWFDEFRTLTAALPRVLFDQKAGLDDMPVQLLLRDFDDVKGGEMVDVAARVRDVDPLVRSALSRSATAPPAPALKAPAARRGQREPSEVQLARRRDLLRALPASNRTALDRPSNLVSKLRGEASTTRERERQFVRHDKDSVRRDLVVLRAGGLVDPRLLVRTGKGDDEVAQNGRV